MAEQLKPYNFEQTQDEVLAMQAKIKNGEIKDFNETEEKVEQDKKEKELSSETIETIMNKVKDINEIGTAYSMISRGLDNELEINKFKSVLSNGLLGNSKNFNREKTKEFNNRPDKIREEWAKSVRETKKGKIYFNIVGVSWYSHKLTNSKIKDGTFYIGNTTIKIIFDIFSYKADYAHEDQWSEKEEQKSKTFRYAPHQKEDYPYENYDKILPNKETAKNYFESHKKVFREAGYNEFDERIWHRFLPPIDDEHGFTLSFRVPPRRFQGIVYDDYNLDEIVKIMRGECMKEKSLLPIYGEDGNLRWPKRMSYEEVKKFVEEREKNKDNLDSDLRPE